MCKYKSKNILALYKLAHNNTTVFIAHVQRVAKLFNVFFTITQIVLCCFNVRPTPLKSSNLILNKLCSKYIEIRTKYW